MKKWKNKKVEKKLVHLKDVLKRSLVHKKFVKKGEDYFSQVDGMYLNVR